MKIGLVGYGYWGKNLARVLSTLGCLDVICDASEKRLKEAENKYGVSTYSGLNELSDKESLDAFIIATPPETHYELAKKILQYTNVFVEKPLCLSSKEGEELIRIAEENKKILMVGHTFLYTPAVRYIEKELMHTIGTAFHIHSTRRSLGLFQQSTNVIWDLAPHEISIINYLMGGSQLVEVNATAYSHYVLGKEDTAQIALKYQNGVTAFLHLSWIDPLKVRQTVIVGSDRMIVYDDTEPLEKIKVYDKGAAVETSNYGTFQTSYHWKGCHIPALSNDEPLQNEIEHFIDCICTGKQPLTDGKNGLEVVKTIERIHDQLQK